MVPIPPSRYSLSRSTHSGATPSVISTLGARPLVRAGQCLNKALRIRIANDLSVFALFGQSRGEVGENERASAFIRPGQFLHNTLNDVGMLIVGGHPNQVSKRMIVGIAINPVSLKERSEITEREPPLSSIRAITMNCDVEPLHIGPEGTCHKRSYHFDQLNF